MMQNFQDQLIQLWKQDPAQGQGCTQERLMAIGELGLAETIIALTKIYNNQGQLADWSRNAFGHQQDMNGETPSLPRFAKQCAIGRDFLAVNPGKLLSLLLKKQPSRHSAELYMARDLHLETIKTSDFAIHLEYISSAGQMASLEKTAQACELTEAEKRDQTCLPMRSVPSFKALDHLPMEYVGPWGEYVGLPPVAVMLLQFLRPVFHRGAFLFHRTWPDEYIRQAHDNKSCSHYRYKDIVLRTLLKCPRKSKTPEEQELQACRVRCCVWKALEEEIFFTQDLMLYRYPCKMGMYVYLTLAEREFFLDDLYWYNAAQDVAAGMKQVPHQRDDPAATPPGEKKSTTCALLISQLLELEKKMPVDHGPMANGLHYRLVAMKTIFVHEDGTAYPFQMGVHHLEQTKAEIMAAAHNRQNALYMVKPLTPTQAAHLHRWDGPRTSLRVPYAWRRPIESLASLQPSIEAFSAQVMRANYAHRSHRMFCFRACDVNHREAIRVQDRQYDDGQDLEHWFRLEELPAAWTPSQRLSNQCIQQQLRTPKQCRMYGQIQYAWKIEHRERRLLMCFIRLADREADTENFLYKWKGWKLWHEWRGFMPPLSN